VTAFQVFFLFGVGFPNPPTPPPTPPKPQPGGFFFLSKGNKKTYIGHLFQGGGGGVDGRHGLAGASHNLHHGKSDRKEEKGRR